MPLPSQLIDGVEVADAAAELHRRCAPPSKMASTAFSFIGFPSNAPLRSTTCSHSKPCSSNVRACAAGIGVEYRRLLHLALAEPDALPVLEVDGREEDHGFHFRKLAISASPSFWLFSGWNWVPAKLSLADERGDRSAVVGGGDERIGVARHEVEGVHEIGVEARFARSGCRRKSDARGRASSVFQPICGILSAGSAGSIALTSPSIQPSPGVSPCSSPRSAIKLQPTQMPRNGLPRRPHALLQRLDHAGNGVEPALAVGEGADARQHDRARPRAPLRLGGRPD